MNNDNIIAQYEILFNSLKEIIKSSEQRIIQDEVDLLFHENVNFFVKSYLISICSYLDAYLQDIAFSYTEVLNRRLNSANLPQNYIYWRVKGDLKDRELAYRTANFSVTKKEISDNLSASPYRTIKLFRLLGIDLTQQRSFESNKDLVNTIVKKRNSIVHHNDNAVDISFSDLVIFIDVIMVYMRAVDDSVPCLEQ